MSSWDFSPRLFFPAPLLLSNLGSTDVSESKGTENIPVAEEVWDGGRGGLFRGRTCFQQLGAAASHLVPFPVLCASNDGEIGALGMEESGCSCSNGWSGVPWGFVVTVIQQHSPGALCKRGSEDRSTGFGGRTVWMMPGRETSGEGVQFMKDGAGPDGHQEERPCCKTLCGREML